MGNQFYGVKIGKEIEYIDAPTEPADIHGMYRAEIHDKRPEKQDVAVEGMMLLPQTEPHVALKRLFQAERERVQFKKLKEALAKRKSAQFNIDRAHLDEINRAKKAARAQQKLLELGYTLEPTTADVTIAKPEMFPPSIDTGNRPVLTGEYMRGVLDRDKPVRKVKKDKEVELEEATPVLQMDLG